MQSLFIVPVFDPLLRALGADQVKFRASLCASALVGLSTDDPNLKSSMPQRNRPRPSASRAERTRRWRMPAKMADVHFRRGTDAR